MITIISPAKSLNFESDISSRNGFSKPVLLKESKIIHKHLKPLKPLELKKLMGISDKLAALNYSRNKAWRATHNEENSRPALLTFSGEVYNGIKAHELTNEQLEFSQEKLRILSGLYGILRPMDLIQAYRLEMGIKLSVEDYKNLYEFWGETINKQINKELKKHREQTLINLASNEYSKVALLKYIKGKVITPVFKQDKDGEYKVITIFAKKARGLMTRFMIENKIEKSEDLKHFDYEGYGFSETLSDKNTWVFTR